MVIEVLVTFFLAEESPFGRGPRRSGSERPVYRAFLIREIIAVAAASLTGGSIT